MKKKAAKKASAGKKPAKKAPATKKAPARKKAAKKALSAAVRGKPEASRSSARDVNALWQAKWPEIVASAWADTPPGFRQRLLTDTRKVLNEFGLPTVEGFEYRVAEGSEKFEIVLPLPAAPVMEESSMRGGPSGSASPRQAAAQLVETPRCGGGDGGGGGGEFTI